MTRYEILTLTIMGLSGIFTILAVFFAASLSTIRERKRDWQRYEAIVRDLRRDLVYLDNAYGTFKDGQANFTSLVMNGTHFMSLAEKIERFYYILLELSIPIDCGTMSAMFAVHNSISHIHDSFFNPESSYDDLKYSFLTVFSGYLIFLEGIKFRNPKETRALRVDIESMHKKYPEIEGDAI